MSQNRDRVPTLDQWKAFSDLERVKIITEWDTYAGEGESLVREIARECAKALSGIRGARVSGPAIQHGGSWVIDVHHPFVFDRRPNVFLGIPIHPSYSDELPYEFQDGVRPSKYIWAPANYEAFVDRHMNEIRRALGNAEMSRTEILSALVGKPFEEWISYCGKSGLQ